MGILKNKGKGLMPFDISRLEKKYSERINEIRRFMSDPLSAQLLDECYIERQTKAELFSNGNHVAARKQSRLKQTKTKGTSADYGSQTRIVRQALAKASGRLSVGLIGEEIRSSGIDLSNIAVGRVFMRLTKNKELHVVEQGSGSVPHQYEKTGKFKAEE